MLVGGARLNNIRIAATPALYACGLAVFFLLFGSRGLQTAIAEGDTRTISLHHTHTDENITITFKRDGRYDEAALEKLNWFLRDWRRQQQTRMDPHLIDLIWEAQREAGSHEPVWVVCGYRSPETNAMLRRRSEGVAKFSQHMLGHAMDFYIPGVPLDQLRAIGLRLQRGGVGFYPTSGSPFVHLDTGSVRHWPRMTREQLSRVFPDGRTVHVPSDGRPLAGYALALDDLRKRGDSPSATSIAAARNAGVDFADANIAQKLVSPFARFLSGGREDEEDDAGAAPVATASNEPVPAAEPLRTRAKAAVVAAVDRAQDKFAAEKTKLAQAATRAGEKLAAEKAKLAQAAMRAEEKLAAQNAKLAIIASKAHVISRAEAKPLAAESPNQIILARGFWQGLPDGATAARPAAAANPLAALPRAPTAAADTAETASITPFAVSSTDRVPSTLALAYAEQPSHETGADEVATAGLASPQAQRATVTSPIAVVTGNNEMTIAVKRVEGRPVSAILTVANRTKPAYTEGSSIDDPWLRAVMELPNVYRFLSITALGVPDFQVLAALMAKPANSVMMTFSADPNAGLAQDHFSGSAIVFVSTVTYPLRTADLR